MERGFSNRMFIACQNGGGRTDKRSPVAFVKAIMTQKYITWLSVCNSKSTVNFESFRGTYEYSDVQAVKLAKVGRL